MTTPTRWRLMTAVTLLVALAAVLSRVGSRPAQAQTEKQNAYSYAAWWSGVYGSPDSDRALAAMADMGVDWVSIVVTQYQDTIDSTDIGPTDGTPTDADVIEAIADAHRLGMKVMLKPHVDLWSDAERWRGEIGLNFDAADWAAWFAEYKTFINHYAALAEAQGVEQFSVGVELQATEAQEAHWRAAVAGVRSRYGGPITYAANHSGSETSLTWWDAVDIIGVDAYYPLTTVNNPTAAQLAAAWEPIVAMLADLSAANGDKPILFTEIGYRSLDGAGKHPWDWVIGGAPDLAEQALLYEAAYRALYDQPWFAGFYWWSWDADPFQGGPCAIDYTVYDKPAENVVRAWYGAEPRAPEAFPPANETVSRAIYGDALAAGWEDWSWGSTVNFAATDQVQSGARSLRVNATQPWGAVFLHHAGIDTSPYYYLEFYLRTGGPVRPLYVRLYDEGVAELRQRPLTDCRYTGNTPLAAQTWTRVRVPLSHLDAAGRTITGLVVQVGEGTGSFWLDGVRLVGANGTFLPLVVAAAEDATTSQAAPGSRFGATPTLRVRNAAADFNAYLKFTVSGLSRPPATATLRLFVTDPGPDAGGVFAVGNTYRTSATPWTEGGLTWRNAPAIVGAALDSGGAAVKDRWVEWDVTPAVTGNGTVSFAVRNGSANVVAYSSAEGARPPQLVLEVAP